MPFRQKGTARHSELFAMIILKLSLTAQSHYRFLGFNILPIARSMSFLVLCRYLVYRATIQDQRSFAFLIYWRARYGGGRSFE